MKYRFVFVTLICQLILLGIGVKMNAQSSDRIANRKIKKAYEYIAKKKHRKAKVYLRYSVNEVSDKEVIWHELAKLSMEDKEYKNAVDYYNMAMNAKPNNRDKYIIQLIDALVKNESYLDAEFYIYPLQISPDWNEEKRKKFLDLRKIIYSKNILNRNVNDSIKIQNLGPEINGPYDDYFPSITKDDSIIIFTRKTNGVEEDFYISKRDTIADAWHVAENMGYPPNSPKHEAAQTVSFDGNYLFFTRCGIVSQNGFAEGECDLYFSHNSYTGWVVPKPLGATINTPNYEGMPSISTDNNVLYFVSNRPGGYGGLDIWMTKYENNLWQIPVNLGPNINTPGDEISPFIAHDNNTLYFSSNYHHGIGGHDIFVSRKQADGTWGKPDNIGAPFNSHNNDISFILDGTASKAYFASDRNGGYGSMDIYEAVLNEKNKPKETAFISGVVVDSIMHDHIANAYIEIRNDEQILASYNSNIGDGSFFFALEPYRNYTITVRRYDYPLKKFDIYVDEAKMYPQYKILLEMVHWSHVDQVYMSE